MFGDKKNKESVKSMNSINTLAYGRKQTMSNNTTISNSKIMIGSFGNFGLQKKKV